MTRHPKLQRWRNSAAAPKDGAAAPSSGAASPSSGVFSELLAQALNARLGNVGGQRFLDVSLDRGQTASHLRSSGAVGWTCRNPWEFAGESRDHPSFIGQVHRLPAADGVFDLLTATLRCSRYHDLSALTLEAARVLRPGGRLFIAEHHPYAQLDEETEQGPPGIAAHHSHLASDYIEAFRQADLSIQRLDEPRWQRRPFLWILVAQKESSDVAEWQKVGDFGGRPSLAYEPNLNAEQASEDPVGSLPPMVTEARRRPALETWVDRALESLWSSVFRMAKKQHGPGGSEWSPRGGQRVLVLSARPGDEVIGCAGALMAHHGGGDQVTVVQLSDGRRSARSEIGRRADGGRHALNPRQRAALSQREAQEAAHLLGFQLSWFGIDDREIAALDLRPVLHRLLDTHRPDILYTPSRCSLDPVAQRLAASLAQVFERPAVQALDDIRIYGLDVPLTPVLANRILPMAPKDMARAAMHTYLSHLGPDHPCWRHRRYSAHLWKRRFPVEEAWQVTANEFHMLHDRLVVGNSSSLHPLRRRPWTDPRAYFGGQSERTRWVRRLLVPR